jgi:hypothetical protein
MSETRKSDSSDRNYKTPFPGPVQSKTSSSPTKKSPTRKSPKKVPSPIVTTPIIPPKARSSIERSLTHDPSQKIQFPVVIEQQSATTVHSKPSTEETVVDSDPYGLTHRRKEDISTKTLHSEHPNVKSRKVKKVKKYYNRQNALIDAYLASNEEEQAEVDDQLK